MFGNENNDDDDDLAVLIILRVTISWFIGVDLQ